MDNNIQQIISQFSKQRVLVIGDAMLDIYARGTASRICREAPVPIVSISQTEEVPGGAANTAVNCATLGAITYFVTAFGKDSDGERLRTALKKSCVKTNGVVQDTMLRTISKQRITADSQLLVRFDQGKILLSDKTEKKLITILKKLYPLVDAVIISDYNYGILSAKIIAAIQQLQKKYKKVLSVDSKRLSLFADLRPTLVKPNYKEAVAFLNLSVKKDDEARIEQIYANGQSLRQYTGSHIAAITMDTKGALIFTDTKTPYRTYAKAQEQSKAAGAGDTYISAFTLSLSSKASLQTSAEIASLATAVVVAKDGTTSCQRDDLEYALLEQKKVIANRDLLRKQIQLYKRQGKRIVFTNGCFDILHRGHVTYLEQAASFGDILIVGVNSDASVRRLKGPERPINTLEDRLSVLSGLSSITQLVPFSENTPINLIEIIQPDVYVKGGDYTRETLPETPVVQNYGGNVEIIPYVVDRSTTNIIKKIKTQSNKKRRQKDFSFVSVR